MGFEWKEERVLVTEGIRKDRELRELSCRDQEVRGKRDRKQ